MRTSLLHPKTGDRRHLRRARERRRSAIFTREAVRSAIFSRDTVVATATATANAVATEDVVAPDTVDIAAVAGQADTRGAAPAADAQARQVRAAGGPLDQASYTCGCGYVFLAAVTTTVQCPHCGDAQAW